MKSGKYTLRELWADGDAEQFVVPELQRDYVWTSKQIEPLLGNLLEAYKKYLGFTLPQFDGLKENQIKELEKIYSPLCSQGREYRYRKEFPFSFQCNKRNGSKVRYACALLLPPSFKKEA